MFSLQCIILYSLRFANQLTTFLTEAIESIKYSACGEETKFE